MNKPKRKSITFLMAEDDADDRLLVKEACRESRLSSNLLFGQDGQDLMDYLNRQGRYSLPACAPRPGPILLDVNMSRKDGRESLEAIKADPHLRHIPEVMMTALKAEQDILRSYDTAAAGFITKPATCASLVEAVRVLGKHWLEIVELPP